MSPYRKGKDLLPAQTHGGGGSWKPRNANPRWKTGGGYHLEGCCSQGLGPRDDPVRGQVEERVLQDVPRERHPLPARAGNHGAQCTYPS